MKKDIINYEYGTFTDCRGFVHHVTVCAVSSTPKEDLGYKLTTGWVCGSNIDISADIYNPIIRTVSLGVSICNPVDTYNKELGEKIAYTKAKKSIPKLMALENGVINTAVVKAFLEQELKFVINNPSKFIKGYYEVEQKYQNKIRIQEELDKLTLEERCIYDFISEGKDIQKLINLYCKYEK